MPVILSNSSKYKIDNHATGFSHKKLTIKETLRVLYMFKYRHLSPRFFQMHFKLYFEKILMPSAHFKYFCWLLRWVETCNDKVIFKNFKFYISVRECQHHKSFDSVSYLLTSTRFWHNCGPMIFAPGKAILTNHRKWPCIFFILIYIIRTLNGNTWRCVKNKITFEFVGFGLHSSTAKNDSPNFQCSCWQFCWILTRDLTFSQLFYDSWICHSLLCT